MALTIQDTFVDMTGFPQAGYAVIATPQYTPFFEQFGGVWKETKAGSLTTTTDGTGLWALTLPYPSVSDPASTKWIITLPDGTKWLGLVPEGIAGPLTMKTLKDTYGWGLVAGPAGSTVSAVQGIPGTGGATVQAESGGAPISGAAILHAGTGMTITESGQTVTFNSSGGGATVQAESGGTPLSGAVVLHAGTNVTITQSGQTITITAASGSSGTSVVTLSTKTANYTLTATDNVIVANAFNITLTLPAAPSVGQEYTITNGPSGSNTIISPPTLAAPSTPIPATAASGGTVLAGIYKVIVTYTNAAGETTGSAFGSVTTTGSTSTLTVPSPGALTGATGWYAYITQPGGSTYYRQQTAGSPTAIGTPLVLTAPPTVTGLPVPVTNTAGTATIFGSGAYAGLQLPYESLTLVWDGSNWRAAGGYNTPDTGTQVVNVNAYGATGNDTTDDTIAIQNAINALGTNGGVVYFPAGAYVLGSALVLSNPKVTLRGAGMKSSIIRAPLSQVVTGALTVSAVDCAIEDLAIDGQYALQTNNGSQSSQCGIYLLGTAHRLSVRRVFLHDTCGHGISNLVAATDMVVEDCLFTNIAVAASQVQSTPAPTTTVFGVGPGMGANFAAGQVLRIGTVTGTVSSVNSITTAVASAASATVFTVNAGYGASFTGGQVIRIGAVYGTILSIATDTITLTSALAAVPQQGQIVSIDTITLTAPLGGAPAAGAVVAVNGAVLKGIYLAGPGTARATIRDCFFSGWSQAIGLWFGAQYNLVEGCRLIANYGYEDAAHTNNRSALELYPNNQVGGWNRIIGNVIDGSTHNCLEWAQGEVGTIAQGNIFRNWAQESGLGSTGVAVEIAGQSGVPGPTTDASLVGCSLFSNGAYASSGVHIDVFTTRVKVEGCSFFGFNTGYAITQTGGDGPSYIGNTFGECGICIFVNAAASANGIIQGNQVTNAYGFPYGPFTFGTAGDNWLIANNVVLTAWNALIIAAGCGNNHRIIGNRFKGAIPVNITGGSSHLLTGNIIEEVADTNAPLALNGTTVLRCIVRGNTILGGAGGSDILLGTSADYNSITDNLLGQNSITTTGAGTHNAIEPNHTATVTKLLNYKLLAANTVGTTQVAVAHGLGYTPTQMLHTMTSTGMIWRSAVADATNVYVTADAAARTCDLYVR